MIEFFHDFIYDSDTFAATMTIPLIIAIGLLISKYMTKAELELKKEIEITLMEQRILELEKFKERIETNHVDGEKKE